MEQNEQAEPITEAEQIILLQGELNASKDVNRILDEENKWLTAKFGQMIESLEKEFGTALDYIVDDKGTVFVGDNTPQSLIQEMKLIRKNLEWEVRELRKLCKEASHLTCQFYDKRWQDWMKNWNQIKDMSHVKPQS